MNENLGSLYFAFRAQLAQWKNDLAQADAEYMRYKAKWETPVAFRGAAVGGGGGSAAGVSTGSGHGGLNVGGTSNGDVTWRLADAVDRHQGREDKATAVARSVLRSIHKDDIDDADFRGPGRAKGGRDKAMDALVAAGARARAEFGVKDLSGDSGPYEFRDYDLAPGKTYRQKHNETIPVAAIPVAKEPSMGSLMGQLGKSRIPIQAMIRSTIVGLVADAVVGMAASSATYDQSMQLSGNDQGLKAKAALQMRADVLGSVPIVGGILRNADRVLTTPIETGLMLTEKQEAYQDRRRMQFAGRTSLLADTAAIRMGPDAVGAGLARVPGIKADALAKFETQSADDRRQFNTLHPQPSDNPDDYNIVFDGEILPGTKQASSRRRMAQARQEYYGEGGTLNRFNNQQNQLKDAAMDHALAPIDQIMQQARYQTAGQMTAIHRAQMQNRFRPVGAGSAFESESYGDLLDYSLRSGMSTLDKSSLRNEGMMAIERLRGSQRDIAENYRWGEGRTYNPYIESPLTFTDRNPETMQDANDSLTKAIQELTSVMRDRLGGN